MLSLLSSGRLSIKLLDRGRLFVLAYGAGIVPHGCSGAVSWALANDAIVPAKVNAAIQTNAMRFIVVSSSMPWPAHLHRHSGVD
jgi:hypothetical protein